MTRELLKKHISGGRVMQIATVSGNRPWICTVYYVEDEAGNLYWLSSPPRRHSQEIEQNPNIAVTIVVKSDQPVVGVQIEGEANVIDDAEVVRFVMERYLLRHGVGKDFYDNFIAGKNQHQLYKLTPKSIVLFDEVNFAGDPRQVTSI